MQPLTSIFTFLFGQQRIDPLRFATEASHAGEVMNLDPRLFLSLGVAAIGIGIVLIFKKVTPRTLNDDRLLFAEICSRHHLSGRQQKLLLEMARQQQLDCPSQLLMDASLWTSDEHRPPRWVSPKIQDELARLRSLLFTHVNQAKEANFLRGSSGTSSLTQLMHHID